MEGFELVAEVDEVVVMSLPLARYNYLPLAFVWDNDFILTGGNRDRIMQMLIDELRKQAKQLGIDTLVSPQGKNSASSAAMQSFGFQKVFESGSMEYLMMSI